MIIVIAKLLQKIFVSAFESLAEPFAHTKLARRLAGGDMSRMMRFNLIMDILVVSIASIFIVGTIWQARFDYAFQALLVAGFLVVLCLLFVAADQRASR
ncbi:MAG: hypothetical protein IH953_00555 [Chloroflexi bacterium]|nr:hypothetical protein [Chloroflexota bacterium]